MKKLFLLVTMATFLTGCETTPQQLRSGKPAATFESNKHADILAPCFIKNFEERTYAGGPVVTSVKPLTNGLTISIVDNYEFIDVVNSNSMTKVTLYSAIFNKPTAWRSQSRTNEVISDIKSCL